MFLKRLGTVGHEVGRVSMNSVFGRQPRNTEIFYLWFEGSYRISREVLHRRLKERSEQNTRESKKCVTPVLLKSDKGPVS